MSLSFSEEERQSRASALRARLARLSGVHTKVRKLNAALANLAVAPRHKQLVLLASASKYVSDIDPPPGVKPMLTIVGNELQSLHEGVQAKAVEPSDLLLMSGVRALKEIEALAAKTVENIHKLEGAGIDDFEGNSALLKKNQAAKEKIPAFNGKEFVVGRAPVAFTFANKQKHSSVGYADDELLEQQGFKTDNLGGYTVVHNQLVIGIDTDAVYDKTTDEDGNVTKVRQREKEAVVVFKKGKPTRVLRAKDREHIDIARRVLRMLEQQASVKYAFISELGATLNGGQFFWVMPAVDFARFNRVFPGGHAKIDKWGFAF